jgi:hypothetical protein
MHWTLLIRILDKLKGINVQLYSSNVLLCFMFLLHNKTNNFDLASSHVENHFNFMFEGKLLASF